MLRKPNPTSALIVVAVLAAMLAAPVAARPSSSSTSGSGPLPDTPVSVSSASELGRLIAWMQPCIAKARDTYSEAKERFEAGLLAGHEFSVVARIRDAEAHIEQVFVRVEEIDGALIRGWIDSQVAVVKTFDRGAPIWLAEDEIVDWVIVSPDGTETGNLIGKNLDRVRNAPPVGDRCRPVI